MCQIHFPSPSIRVSWHSLTLSYSLDEKWHLKLIELFLNIVSPKNRVIHFIEDEQSLVMQEYQTKPA